MANRTFNKDFLSLVKRRVEVLTVVQVGSAGAVTLLKRHFSAGTVTFGTAPTTGVGYAVGNGEGVRGVARTGTGAWTITLSDSYLCIFGVQFVGYGNGSGTPTIASVGLVSGSTNVTTSTGVGNAGVVAIQLVDFAGAAADPASGDVLCLATILGDASEP